MSRRADSKDWKGRRRVLRGWATKPSKRRSAQDAERTPGLPLIAAQDERAATASAGHDTDEGERAPGRPNDATARLHL